MYDAKDLSCKSKAALEPLSKYRLICNKRTVSSFGLGAFFLALCLFAGRTQSELLVSSATPIAGINLAMAGNLSAYPSVPYTATAGISSVLKVNLNVENELIASDSEVVSTAASEGDESEAAAKSDFGYENLGIADCDGNLNVRKAPAESAELAGKLPEHGAVEITGEEDGWYAVNSGEVEGFVKSDYIITGDKAYAIAEDEISSVATITADGLRVREDASTDSRVILNMHSGDKLPVIEETGDWVKVSLDSDEEGYVSREFVKIKDELPTAKTMEELAASVEAEAASVGTNLVNNALQYVGNRYVWGGTSLTRGVDCSGFTMQIYAQYGISLPHSSRAQAGYGRSISASEAQPGDLFFYGSGGISHVAIYMGGGQIVHAASSRSGIKVSNAFYRTPVKVVTLLH